MSRKELMKAMKDFEGKIFPKKLFHKNLKNLGLKIVGSTLEDSPNLSDHFYYVSDKQEENFVLVGLEMDDNYEKVTNVNTSVLI